jgi:succinoglycan biosynthesis protein ExoW
MTTVTVIIPYFQKRAGILRRTLYSVLQQHLSPGAQVDVIVVDDGSPIPARMETEGLDFAPPFNLIVVEQLNSGVASARNVGLRRASEETTYIAFLDSDDIWEPEHLAKAIAALDLEFDLYFCDNQRIGQFDSQFSTLASENFLSIVKSRSIGDEVYEIDKDAFFKCCLRTFVCQLSSVVYRRSIAGAHLFDPSLRAAGEDSLFLLQLAVCCRRICCTTKVWVTCADGVNIYYSKFNWNDPGHLIRYMGIILMYCKFQEKLSLSDEDRCYIAGRLKLRRRDFAFLTVRYFFKKLELWPAELVEMTRNDKHFWRWYMLCALYVIICFPVRLYAPVKE